MSKRINSNKSISEKKGLMQSPSKSNGSFSRRPPHTPPNGTGSSTKGGKTK